MTPAQALACIEQERLDVLAEGFSEADCNMVAAYVLASAYRKLLAPSATASASGDAAMLRAALDQERDRVKSLDKALAVVEDIATGVYSDNIKTLVSMVEGLHAMIFGVTSIESGDFALKALKDGGSIHEYVHSMIRLLPPRVPPLDSDGIGKPDSHNDIVEQR